jgi:hypothetical protein
MSNTGADEPYDIDAELADVDWTAELADMNVFNDTMKNALAEVHEWLEGETEPDGAGNVHTRGGVLFGVYMLLLARMLGYDDAADLAEGSPEAHLLYVQMIHGLLSQGVLINGGASVMMITPEVASYLGFKSQGE